MKYQLTLILCIFITRTCCAQSNVFDLGIEGGPTISSLHGSTFIDDNHHARLGYSGGFFAQYNFRKIFSIRTGIYRELKGSTFEEELPDNKDNSVEIVKGKERFDYLTIPILFRFTFGEKINYFFNTGLCFGTLLQQKESPNIFSNYSDTKNSHYRKNETCVAGGIGLSYKWKHRLAFSLEIRDQIGLTQINKAPQYYGNVYTNQLNFHLGASYRLGDREYQSIKKDSTSHRKKLLHVKINYSLFYSFMKINSDVTYIRVNEGDYGEYLSFNSSDEEGKFGHEIGIVMETCLTKKLNLSFGISYSNVNFETRDSTLFTVSGYHDWPPGVYLYQTKGFQLEQHYKLASVPLILSYQIPLKNNYWEFGAGPSIDFMYEFKTSRSYSAQSGYNGRIYDYKFNNNLGNLTYSFSYIITTGMSVRMNKSLEYGIEPKFRFYFPSHKMSQRNLINSGYNQKARFYTLGLSLFCKF